MLKTIEEPPQNTLIILITHDLKKLPKTIISRCINIKFNKLKKKEFDDFLKYYFPKRSNNLEQLYKLTRGAPGLLNEYLLNNGDELFNLTKQLLELENASLQIEVTRLKKSASNTQEELESEKKLMTTKMQAFEKCFTQEKRESSCCCKNTS